MHVGMLIWIVLTSIAIAWDAESHRVSARIASKLLCGAAKSFLYDHLVDEKYPSVSKAIAEVSSWADTEAREIYPQTRLLHF